MTDTTNKAKITFPDGRVYFAELNSEYEIKSITDKFGNKIDNISDLNSDNVTIEYSNGNRYEGDFMDGQMEGYGTFTYAKGDIYKGEFKNGKLNGKGTRIFNNKVYIGDFIDGRRTGHGRLILKNGDIHEGRFERNLFKGGIFLKKIEGKENEFEEYKFENGKTIEKTRTVQINTDSLGNITEEDTKNNYARIFFKNGDRYEGGFVNGHKEWYATFTWADGNRYDGEFKNDRSHGQGTYTWANGDRYDGGFVNGRGAGRGTLNWINGDHYEGDFVNGQRTGQGILTWVDGDRYEGDFVNGQRTGQGRLVLSNGDILEGKFENDKFKEGISLEKFKDKENEFEEYKFENGRREKKPTRTVQVIDENGKIIEKDLNSDFARVFGKNKYEYYEGGFRDNKPNGEGKMTIGDYQYIEGKFEDGELTEERKVKIWAATDEFYEGKSLKGLVDDTVNVKGKVTAFKDDSYTVFKGNFNKISDGSGKMIESKNGELESLYSGTFKDGKLKEGFALEKKQDKENVFEEYVYKDGVKQDKPTREVQITVDKEGNITEKDLNKNFVRTSYKDGSYYEGVPKDVTEKDKLKNYTERREILGNLNYVLNTHKSLLAICKEKRVSITGLGNRTKEILLKKARATAKIAVGKSERNSGMKLG